MTLPAAILLDLDDTIVAWDVAADDCWRSLCSRFAPEVGIDPDRLLAGITRSRDWLLEHVRDREYEIFDRSIDMHVSALRKKLGDDLKDPRFIRTYRNAGYMLIDPNQEPPRA